MAEEKKGKIGFINKSTFDPSRLTGTLYWEEETFRITNFTTEGDITVADVRKKTGEKYIAKNGNEYDAYKDCGAIRFSRATGEGVFVTKLAGEVVKYPFTSAVTTDPQGNPTRRLSFRAGSTNEYREMFDDAPEASELASSDKVEGVDDDIPF